MSSIRSVAFLIVFCGLVVGCSQPDQPSAASTPAADWDLAQSSLDAELKERPRLSATQPAPPATAALPPTIAALPFSTPQAFLEELAELDGVPCGSLLPLESERTSPLVTRLPEVEIPEDIIPSNVLPALRQILTNPDAVGLAAYQIGFEESGLYLNADAPMPLASVVKIINLIAYAEAVDAGELDPGAWIPLAEMNRYYLPGMDLGSHNRAVNDLEERQLVAFTPPATPLEEVPWMMIRHSSNAAADYLHLLLGQDQIERTAVALNLSSQTAPCPWIGQFLIMSNHTRVTNNQLELERYIADRPSYGLDVMRLAEAFARDDDFRNAELDWRGHPPSISTQIQFSENLNAQASPREYAQLMARILQNGLSSPFVNILVRRNLEWPMTFQSNQENFTAIGMKDGSLPGILTTLYYGQRRSDANRLVVALFFRRLPMSTYRQWRRDLPHDEFARWLLTDPEGISMIKQLISE